jgi:hypothetical protein
VRSWLLVGLDRVSVFGSRNDRWGLLRSRRVESPRSLDPPGLAALLTPLRCLFRKTVLLASLAGCVFRRSRSLRSRSPSPGRDRADTGKRSFPSSRRRAAVNGPFQSTRTGAGHTPPQPIRSLRSLIPRADGSRPLQGSRVTPFPAHLPRAPCGRPLYSGTRAGPRRGGRFALSENPCR